MSLKRQESFRKVGQLLRVPAPQGSSPARRLQRGSRAPRGFFPLLQGTRRGLAGCSTPRPGCKGGLGLWGCLHQAAEKGPAALQGWGLEGRCEPRAKAWSRSQDRGWFTRSEGRGLASLSHWSSWSRMTFRNSPAITHRSKSLSPRTGLEFFSPRVPNARVCYNPRKVRSWRLVRCFQRAVNYPSFWGINR